MDFYSGKHQTMILWYYSANFWSATQQSVSIRHKRGKTLKRICWEYKPTFVKKSFPKYSLLIRFQFCKNKLALAGQVYCRLFLAACSVWWLLTASISIMVFCKGNLGGRRYRFLEPVPAPGQISRTVPYSLAESWQQLRYSIAPRLTGQGLLRGMWSSCSLYLQAYDLVTLGFSCIHY